MIVNFVLDEELKRRGREAWVDWEISTRRTMASLTAIMKQSLINKGVPEAWERENE